jgi:hypothetical protein
MMIIGPGIKVRMQQLAPGFVQQVQVSDSSCVARGKSWKTGCKACPNGMTEQELAEIKARAEKAVEGPWEFDETNIGTASYKAYYGLITPIRS